LVFSQAMELGTAHGSVAAAADPATPGITDAATTITATTVALSAPAAHVLAFHTVALDPVTGPPS
jgi:hypothetical protein